MFDDKAMSPMLNIPVLPLVSMFVITILVACLIAWHYRNDYEPLHYFKAYLIYALPFLGVSLIFHLKIVLIIGIYIFGMIILIFRNQHYFDK